jgi:hypothetical protein
VVAKRKTYVLSESDRRAIVDLLRRSDISTPYKDDDSRETIWLRVKTGTTIMPMSGPDQMLVPGEGIGVQWRQSQRINNGALEAVLTKVDKFASGDVSSEGQDYTSTAGDLEYNVYNYTPYELFECSWFCAELSKRGQWVVNSPPLPVYFAECDSELPAGGVADAELGALDYDVIASGDSPTPSYFTGITRPVFNPGEAIAANTPFIVAQEPGGKFVRLSGGGDPPPKRVKFRLVGNLMTNAYSYWADATVIDPMNSGLTVDASIKVRDPKGQFQFAGPDCMGIAAFSKLGDAIYTEGPNPPDTFTSADQGQWVIEQCDQFVTKVRADMTGGFVAWASIPSATSITIDQKQSYWPYIHDHVDDAGDISELCINSHGFTAGSGKVWLERRVQNIYAPDSTRTITPVQGSVGGDPSEVTFEWHIVRVEKPTARYIETVYEGGSFIVVVTDLLEETTATFYEGHDPAENSAFTNLDGSVINGFDADCPLQEGETGIAFLDDVGGGYRTFATQSAMYGTARKINAVAEAVDAPPSAPSGGPSQGPIGTTSDSECGEFKYNLLRNLFVFGDPQATGSECKMDYVDPPIEVDTFVNAENVQVITGTEINAQGELEFTTKTIKACPEDAANIPLSYNTTDVVTDISCNGDVLQKSYKTIKYLGSEVSSGGPVNLTCSDPANYNWETIFNNHIYNEDWWTVSYYDITYPEGCEPCGPLGCCTYVDDNGNPAQGSLTEADCNLKSQSTWDGNNTECPAGQVGCCTLIDGQGGTISQVDGLLFAECEADFLTDPNAVNWTWSEGDCSGGNDCEGDTISNFSIGGLAAGACTATFSQTGTATISNGSATVSGTWTGYDGFMPQTASGTVTVTTDGTNWAWSSDIPWDSGATVSGTDTGTQCSGTYTHLTGTTSHPFSSVCLTQYQNATWIFDVS